MICTELRNIQERSMDFVQSQDSDIHSHIQGPGGCSEKPDIWRDSRSLDRKSARTGVPA